MALTPAALLGLRLWVERVLPGRLRRSLHAWTLALLSAATAGLMAEAVYLGLVWTAPLPESVTPLLSGLAVLMVLTWAVARLTGQVKATLVPLLLGDVAFGSFALQQPAWPAVVLGTANLLAVLIDDGASWLLGTTADAKRTAEEVSGKPGAPLCKGREQAAVLLVRGGPPAAAGTIWRRIKRVVSPCRPAASRHCGW